jgi:predicted nucleotidyltransferase
MPSADPSTAHLAALDRFLAELRPRLVAQGAQRAYLFGSWARGEADPWSDIDVIVVAPTEREPVERFRDYLTAIAGAGVGVDLFVYTPEEFEALLEEERPFLIHALEGARVIHEG